MQPPTRATRAAPRSTVRDAIVGVLVSGAGQNLNFAGADRPRLRHAAALLTLSSASERRSRSRRSSTASSTAPCVAGSPWLDVA